MTGWRCNAQEARALRFLSAAAHPAAAARIVFLHGAFHFKVGSYSAFLHPPADDSLLASVLLICTEQHSRGVWPQPAAASVSTLLL